MKYKCLCCGFITLSSRAEFDICPVCFWEDDCYILIDKKTEKISSLYYENQSIPEEDLLDIPSGANHRLTLREARLNYSKFGACDKDMIKYVRKPLKEEYPT